MRISKSRFMEMFQCKKAGWLSIHQPELIESDSMTDDILKQGTEIGDLARAIIGDYQLVEIVTDKAKMIKDTEDMIKSGVPILAEASFSYNGCFCSTDILKVLDKDKKIIDLYEVKSTTSIKSEHLVDMAFQYYVLTGVGYTIEHFYHVHINADYEREEELDISQLFSIENAIPDIILNLPTIIDNVDDFKDTLDHYSEPNIDIGCQCHKPYDCPYFEYCTRNFPSPNVFEIKGKGITFAKKVELYSKGIISYEDILSRKPKINEQRMNEIRCAVEGTDLPVQMDKLKKFMKEFVYPINFLDFESYQNPIPEYYWQKPFIQIPFQYSIHVLYEDGRLEHKEFIAPVGTDARIQVRDRLIADLSENEGSIVAYNAPFEKMVIKDLAEISPGLYAKLMRLRTRVLDLMVPFANQWIYKNSFKGSYSIKYVLPGLFPDDEELNYHNLDTIQNGSIAMKVYQNMKNYTKEEQDLMFQRLYKYCGLDTFALVKVFLLLKSWCEES